MDIIIKSSTEDLKVLIESDPSIALRLENIALHRINRELTAKLETSSGDGEELPDKQ